MHTLKWSIIVRTLKKTYHVAFKENLFLTNTLTYVSLYGFGDFMQQSIESHFYNSNTSYDFKRTGKMMAFACFAGPVNHFWYAGLDRYIIKGTISQIVGKKILADQLIFAPAFIATFFIGIGFIEQKKFRESFEELKDKAWTVYKADCTVWPAVQALNFYLIPSHLRVTYINIATLGWNTYLSYIKHKPTTTVYADDISKEKCTVY